MACKAVAVFFIYLALSTHAIRLKKSKLQHKHEGSQPPPSEEQKQAWNLLRGQEEAKVKEELYAKTASFRAHPSMPPLGSGGEFLMFLHGLSEEDSQLVQGTLHDDIKALLEDGLKANVRNAAADLEGGINLWFENHKTSATYHNCEFRFGALKDHLHQGSNMTLDSLVNIAPDAITSRGQRGEPCKLHTKMKEFLTNHKQAVVHALEFVHRFSALEFVRRFSGKGSGKSETPPDFLAPVALVEVASKDGGLSVALFLIVLIGMLPSYLSAAFTFASAGFIHLASAFSSVGSLDDNTTSAVAPGGNLTVGNSANGQAGDNAGFAADN